MVILKRALNYMYPPAERNKMLVWSVIATVLYWSL